MIARTHSDAEAARLRARGRAVQAVYGERELAVQMARYALRRYGVSGSEAEAIAQGLRTRTPPVGEPRALPGRRSVLDRIRRLARRSPPPTG